jgi:vacuolar-type H+-ATPase subunit H
VAVLQRELHPVFEVLEDAQRRAGDIVADAERQARERRTAASTEAARLFVEARLRADSVRTRAAAERLAWAEGERRRLLDVATTQAERIDSVGSARLPSLVDEVVRRALQIGAQTP